MKTKKWAWAAGAVLMTWLTAGQAYAVGAGTTAYLNIDVTITANLSVNVDAASSSTQAATWDVSVANDKFPQGTSSSATVTNDSGAQTEKWALSTNAQSIDTTGGAETWGLSASSSVVSIDSFSVQAVFGSSQTLAGGCPLGSAANWNNDVAPVLTTSPVTYTSTKFADPLLNNAGTPNPDVTAGGANGRMHATSKRALCWRVITPLSTSTVHKQNIQVIVTAQNP